MQILFLFTLSLSILSSALPSLARLAELTPQLPSLRDLVKDNGSPVLAFIHGRALADPEDLVALYTFVPARQLISTTGTHKFIAPRPNDLRSPCTGPNALANHGYLARNGLTNLVEAADAATVKAFGVSPDLALIISYAPPSCYHIWEPPHTGVVHWWATVD